MNLSSLNNEELKSKMEAGVFMLLFRGGMRFIPAIILLVLLIFISYAGAESGKIILRNHFGKKGITWEWVLVACLLLVVVVVYSIFCYLDLNDAAEFIGVQGTHLITAIFYTVVIILLIIKTLKTINQKEKGNANDLYRGDSFFLYKLISAGWKPATVQNLAEPLLLVAVGVFMTPINKLFGIPMIFCGLSMWVQLAVETIVGIYKHRNTLSNEGYVHSQHEDGFADAE